MNTTGPEKSRAEHQKPKNTKAPAMAPYTISVLRACRTTALVVFVVGVLTIAGGVRASGESVVCDETTLSVNALDMKAEDLIKDIGAGCGIRMVERGEVFTDDVFSVQFENLPLREGLERVLRTLDIPNHMLYFAGDAGSKRISEIYLIGQKGGERELTAGRTASSPEERTPARKPGRSRRGPGSNAQVPPDDAASLARQAAQALTEIQEEAQAPATPEDERALEEQEELEEKYIDVLDEIMDEQFESDEDINAERVLELYRQALPPDMRDNIPAEVIEEIELLSDD